VWVYKLFPLFSTFLRKIRESFLTPLENSGVGRFVKYITSAAAAKNAGIKRRETHSGKNSEIFGEFSYLN
jgi:hypothetical protein